MSISVTINQSLISCALASILLSACQTFDTRSLEKQPEVISAKRIGVSQSSALNNVLCTNPDGKFELISLGFTPLPLPENATARRVAAAIGGSRKAEVIQPIASASKHIPDLGKTVLTLSERTVYDLVIHVMPIPTSTSNGYFNAGAGVYIPGASIDGGYAGTFTPMGQHYNFNGRLLVSVFRGSDGALLRQFALRQQVIVKKVNRQSGIDELLNLLSSQIAAKIFGEALQ